MEEEHSLTSNHLPSLGWHRSCDEIIQLIDGTSCLLVPGKKSEVPRKSPCDIYIKRQTQQDIFSYKV
jgi:hypothetical protein